MVERGSYQPPTTLTSTPFCGVCKDWYFSRYNKVVFIAHFESTIPSQKKNHCDFSNEARRVVLQMNCPLQVSSREKLSGPGMGAGIGC